MKIVVIGASSGLGAAVALTHASLGDEVIVTGRRIRRLESLMVDAFNLELVENDLLSPMSIGQLLSYSRGVNLIYYCAAVADPAPVDEIMRVNFEAFVELAVGLEHDEQKLIAISSLAAIIPFGDLSGYCA